MKPAGWPTVIPRVVVEHPEKLVAFLRSVFGATGDYHEDRPAELWLGESLVMVSGDDTREPRTAFLYVYVDDVDQTFERALAAGAVSVEAPIEMPYGDRRGMVVDPWGNTWQIATHRRFVGP